MCEWGDHVRVRVLIPAVASHTGEERWDTKGIDRCIAPIVEALTEAGIYTAGSCCGHGKRDGGILLHDGRELLIPRRRLTQEEASCVLKSTETKKAAKKASNPALSYEAIGGTDDIPPGPIEELLNG